HAVKLDAPAVQVKSVVRGEAKLANTEERRRRVELLLVREHAADGDVLARRGDVPTYGLLHAEHLLDFESTSRRKAERAHSGFDRPTSRIHESRRDLDGLRLRFEILDGRAHADGCFALVDLRRRDEGAEASDVNGLEHDELDLSIDAGTGVPARLVVVRVDVHGDDVLLAELDELARIDAERHVAIVPTTGLLAVHVNARHRHDA